MYTSSQRFDQTSTESDPDAHLKIGEVLKHPWIAVSYIITRILKSLKFKKLIRD